MLSPLKSPWFSDPVARVSMHKWSSVALPFCSLSLVRPTQPPPFGALHILSFTTTKNPYYIIISISKYIHSETVRPSTAFKSLLPKKQLSIRHITKPHSIPRLLLPKPSRRSVSNCHDTAAFVLLVYKRIVVIVAGTTSVSLGSSH